MLVHFPDELTEDEERLLKKMAKMKKKKKQLIDLKTSKEQKNAESIALKRKSSDAPAVNNDAKETAKKLVMSGIIKLENENKEKGFKRSLSRRDEKKCTHLNIDNEFASYSSYGSLTPNSRSPHSAPTLFNNTPAPASPNIQQRNRFNFNNQRPTFNHSQMNQNRFQFQQQHQQPSNSLHIKGNVPITEEFLKTILSIQLSDVNIVSIDMKKGYAFVSVDKKESAENTIKILNGKTFNDIQLSVSFARPRKSPYEKTFNHTNSSGSLNEEQLSNTALMHNWNEITQSPATYSSSQTSRSMVSYDDDPELFN